MRWPSGVATPILRQPHGLSVSGEVIRAPAAVNSVASLSTFVRGEEAEIAVVTEFADPEGFRAATEVNAHVASD